MNRRQFLKTASAATVLAANPVFSQAGVAAPNRSRIPIGFLGATHAHAEGKLKVVLGSPDYELVGVCEESAETRRRLERLRIRWLAREELLARSAVIAVESDVRDHARHAKIALQAGKHVHCEKPPATNLADLRELIALARQKNLWLQVGYQWRYNPGINGALHAARQGWLGEVFFVRAAINTLVPAERRAEWAEFHGGTMFELAGHIIDPMVRLLGKPLRVTPVLRTHGSVADNLKDNTLAVLEFPRALGVVSSATLQAGAGAQRFFEVSGTLGNALVRPIEPPMLQLDLTKPAGPQKAGRHTQSWPDWTRYGGDFAELAAAVRGDGRLSATLDEELSLQETLLQASEMPLNG